MSSATQFNKGNHCVYSMYVHLIFVTKYRKKIFDKTILKFASLIFNSVCDSFDAQLLEFEGEKDHVHMLIAYHPKVSVSKLVNILKGRSSRYLKLKFPYLKKYYWKSALWSSSFFASSCGGAPISVLKEYIRHQKAPT